MVKESTSEKRTSLPYIISIGLSAGGVLGTWITLLIFGGGLNSTSAFFQYATTVYLGLLSVVVIINVLTLITGWEEKWSERKKKGYLIGGIILLIIGSLIIFFVNWLLGGIIGFISLMLITLSKNKLEGIANTGATLLLIGFLLLLIVPSVAAYTSMRGYDILSYIMAVGGFAMAIVGMYFILMAAKHTARMIASYGGIATATFSIFLMPAHEFLRIHSNMVYGIYDLTLFYFSFIIFWILWGMFVFELSKDMKIVKMVDRGYEALKNMEWDKAEEYFIHALKIDEDCVDALNGLGIGYMMRGKNEEALRTFKRLLKIKPSEVAYTNMGNVYFKMGKYDDAIKMYKEALKRNESYYNAIVNLARAYMEKGMMDEVEKYLKLAKEKDPNRKSAYIVEAIYYGKVGDEKKLGEIKEEIKRMFGEDLIVVEGEV